MWVQPREREAAESVCQGKILWNAVESKRGKKGNDDAGADEKPRNDDQEMKLMNCGSPGG